MKKSLIVLLSVLLFITVNINSVSALGVDTVIKATGGKMVVRGLAESAGMMLSPKQLDNVVEVIQKRTYDGDQKSIDFMNKANDVIDMPSQNPASKTGFKKFVLDPLLWLSGLDLIFDIVDGFKEGYDSGQPVQKYNFGLGSTWSWGSFNGTNTTAYLYIGGYKTDLPQKAWVGDYLNNPDVHVRIINIVYGTDYLDVTYNGMFTTDNVVHSTYTKRLYNYEFVGDPTIAQIQEKASDKIIDHTVVEGDLINADTVNYKTVFDNDTYNTNTDYELELELPDLPDYGDITPWNDKDINIENEVVVLPPVVVDPDDDDDDVIGAVIVKGDPIETPSNFFTLMGDMGAKLHDTYNGVVKFFSDSVSGMEKLMVGSAGLVVFMTEFFDIFPTEFTTVLTVGFMMGFIMYFFRR